MVLQTEIYSQKNKTNNGDITTTCKKIKKDAVNFDLQDTNFMMGGVEVKIDTALVLEAQKGGQEGFTRLYEAVAPSLYRTALYTLGNSHDAEDVVSETFIEAYRGLSSLRDPQAFAPWIYRILSADSCICLRRLVIYGNGRRCWSGLLSEISW